VQQLTTHQLSDAHLALMRPLSQRGAALSKKARLRRALALERAGVPLDQDARRELYPDDRLSPNGAVPTDESPCAPLGSGLQGARACTTTDEQAQEGSENEQERQDEEAWAGRNPSAASWPGVDSGSNDSRANGGDGGRTGAAAAAVVDGAIGSSESEPEEQRVVGPPLPAEEQQDLRERVAAARRAAGLPASLSALDEDPEDLAVRAAEAATAAAASAEAAAIRAADLAPVAGARKCGYGNQGAEAMELMVGLAAGAGTARHNSHRHRLVHVVRAPEVEAARAGLPIIAMEQVNVGSLLLLALLE
jgi:hypothetical protein